MNDPHALRKLLKSSVTIPTLPAIVRKITALIGDPDTGTREIGALVAEDAPLAAKVLRIANSSFYGLASKCMSTEQASTVLGLKVLRNIVTQVSVIDQFEHIQPQTGFDPTKIWEHSSLTAQIAAGMANHCSKVRVLSHDEAYVCGLLHKIGKIILLDSLGKSYAVLLKECEDYPDDGRVSERETSELGFNHQDVGAILADRWSLPNAIVDAIQLHGQPISKLGGRLHVHVIAVASRAAAFVLKGDRAAAQMVLLQEGDELGLDPRIARTLLDRLDHESSEAA